MIKTLINSETIMGHYFTGIYHMGVVVLTIVNVTLSLCIKMSKGYIYMQCSALLSEAIGVINLIQIVRILVMEQYFNFINYN